MTRDTHAGSNRNVRNPVGKIFLGVAAYAEGGRIRNEKLVEVLGMGIVAGIAVPGDHRFVNVLRRQIPSAVMASEAEFRGVDGEQHATAVRCVCGVAEQAGS